MAIYHKNPLIPFLALGALLAGCSSPEPVSYHELHSSPVLQDNMADASGRVPYSYSTPVVWENYRQFILNPVTIYRGADNQFGDMPEEDKTALARYMQDAFAKQLITRYNLTHEPVPGTLLVQVTLTGAETNTSVLSTVSRFDLAFGVYNGVQAARGKEGTFTGAVMYAVEIYDAQSRQLLKSYISKQYPNVYDIGSGMGSLAASKTGIEKGAEALLAELQ